MSLTVQTLSVRPEAMAGVVLAPDTTHLARLGHREDVKGDERFHGPQGRARAAGQLDSRLRQ
jgi:hypothetical protein